MHREMWRTPEKERPHNSVVCPAGDGMTPQWLNNFHDLIEGVIRSGRELE
jgi:hypothetical protein